MLEKTKGFVAARSLKLFYIAFTILIILILMNTCQKLSYENHYLEGLWIANEDYCQAADIDGMLLYIGPAEHGCRGAYIIMHANNAVIANKKFKIKFTGSLLDYTPMFRKNMNKQISLIDDKEDDIGMEDAIEDPCEIKLSKIMPLMLNANIDLVKGKMIWKDDDGKVYAELYKDNILSEQEKPAE